MDNFFSLLSSKNQVFSKKFLGLTIFTIRYNIQIHAHQIWYHWPYSVKSYEAFFRPSQVTVGTGRQSAP